MHSKNDYLENTCLDFSHQSTEILENKDLHRGSIVERIVRRDRMDISEIARNLHISRRTLYNWFEIKRLSADTICQIGIVIGHDFSKDFEGEFADQIKNANLNRLQERVNSKDKPEDATLYWMDKYIKLLEKFNDVLSHDTVHKMEGFVWFFSLSGFVVFNIVSNTDHYS